MYTDINGNIKIGKLITHFILGLFAFCTVLGSFTQINAQEVGIVTRLGAINRNIGEGFHWKIPYFESVTTMNLSEQKMKMAGQIYSKDGQTIDAEVTVNYVLNPVSVEQTYREARNNYQDLYLNPVVGPSTEEVFTRYTAQGLIDNKAKLPIEIKNLVIERVTAANRGVLIRGVELTKFDFQDEYEAAIRNKQVQEQNALAQVNITAQEKEKKEQEILKAQALSEKTRLEAIALASSQGDKVIAKIEAEAQLKIAEKWDGKSCQNNCYGAALTSPLPLVQVGK